MQPSSIYFLPVVFFIPSMLYHLSRSQQTYHNNINNINLCLNHSSSNVTQEYLCNNHQKSCTSFLTFRSSPPHDSPVSIARLLGSDASYIASINNISNIDKIPSDRQIIVPVSCSCNGNYYQHSTSYTTVQEAETFFTITNHTYQGLTTCQALMSENSYEGWILSKGLKLTVPLRCACPTSSQAANGVGFMLTYVVTSADLFSSSSDVSSSIGKVFGVSNQSIIDVNGLKPDSPVYPFKPVLVPLKSVNCTVEPGNFVCSCPDGHFAYERKYGRVCIPDKEDFPVKLVTLLGGAIGAGLLCLVLFGFWLYQYLKKKKSMRRKERLFKQNGGILLQQRMSAYQENGGKTRIFTAEELQRATNNYNRSRFLGHGGFGIVYKGMLPDGTIVAVKKSRAIHKSQSDQFINEVVILSQINHRNVVKLLGCCLETEFPLLVYEFIPNGTLSDHIHELDPESSLPWANRLRIASEVAGAVAYMHSAASISIFHRDIKSSNILLDEKYSAKVSDFGTSRSVPSDKTHLTTAVQGTFGYLDPEYFQSSQFTEKSDVYSFGVVLVELLTGEKPISLTRDEEPRNLVVHFISSIKENRLLQILDIRVATEARTEYVLVIAELAKRCLRLNGKKRPTMKEVAMELEGLRKHEEWLQIYEEPHSMHYEVSDLHTIDESLDESIALPLKMESARF